MGRDRSETGLPSGVRYPGTCTAVIGPMTLTIKAQNSKIWVNTLWGSICGGDDRADAAAFKTGDLDYVYGRLLDNGVSMIQTDRPALLIKYLQEKGRHPEFRKGRIRFK